MQRAKSKTSVLERDIEEADAESIARLAQFGLSSSMVGRHDKPWYANAVEQLPNVEMTHSKAIQLKLFFSTQIPGNYTMPSLWTSGLVNQECPG